MPNNLRSWWRQRTRPATWRGQHRFIVLLAWIEGGIFGAYCWSVTSDTWEWVVQAVVYVCLYLAVARARSNASDRLEALIDKEAT